MRKQASELRPVPGDPLRVFHTTGEPRIGHQSRAPDETPVRHSRFGIWEIAVVDNARSQMLPQMVRCPAGEQMVDMAADAKGDEDHPGSPCPDHLPDPGADLSGQSGVGGRDPAAMGVEADGRVGRPSPPAERSGGGSAGPAVRSVPQSKVNRCGADLGKDRRVFRTPVCIQGFSVRADGTQSPADGQRPRGRGGLREHGNHRDVTSMREIGKQCPAGQDAVIEVRGHCHHRTGTTCYAHQTVQLTRHLAVTSPDTPLTTVRDCTKLK
jgi:hypothetical protein